VILLASSSVTRMRLLRDAGVEFTVGPTAADERRIKAVSGLGPADLAEHLAAAKAHAVSTEPGAFVIGADQTLELDGARLDKPQTAAMARRQLLALRGRSHQLHTAAAIVRDGATVWAARRTAILRVRAFSDAWLEDYLERCGAVILGSAGAYHLEGLGAQLFEHIDGDYFSVLGLPLVELLGALRELGALQS
jgi:septum formation protein